MLNIKKALAPLLIALAVVCISNGNAMRLSQFAYKAASVFPVYTHRNIKYGIIGREAYGRDRGTYDDFGGSRDPGESHPVITAAREWSEEGLVIETTGMDESAIRNFIDIEKSNNTECIVAYTRSEKVKTVVYITDVGHYRDKLLHNFYGARNKATKFENKEKDRIAIVNLATLKNAIINHKDNTKPVKVRVAVLNECTNTFDKEVVRLRPFFVSKLRFYFLDKPYQQGMNKKIRFYSVGYQVPVQQSWGDWFKSWIKKK